MSSSAHEQVLLKVIVFLKSEKEHRGTDVPLTASDLLDRISAWADGEGLPEIKKMALED